MCDAFFYRGKDVAVLGSGEYALHECNELLNVVGSVTLLTNGAEPTAEFTDKVRIDKRKLAGLVGEGTFGGVKFDDGGGQHSGGTQTEAERQAAESWVEAHKVS